MLLTIFYGLSAIVAIVYLWFKWKFTFWTKQGVYQSEPSFPFGTVSAFFTNKEHLNDVVLRQANETKNLKYYGGYFLQSPILWIRDPDMVRQITIKDFEYFVDRNNSMFQKLFKSGSQTDKIWDVQMTNAQSEEWKNLRSTFTPIFTSGKMKAMLIFMQETCDQLVNAFDKYAEKNEAFEVKRVLGSYSMDTIASCAFGVDAESFTNENSKFVQYASTIFTQGLKDGMKMFLAIVPGGLQLMRALDISVMPETETKFFYEAVMSSLNHRRQHKERRNDLIDLMLDAIKGDLEHDTEDLEQFEKDAKLNHHSKQSFDELVIVATAIVLLVAGYDTTGTTLAWACYELAKNPEIQEKLRQEVEDILDGDPERKLTYDDIQSMTYLDQVINETLRFHNPVGALQRSAAKEYKVPGTDIVLPKDTMVWINVLSMHFDQKHYENPHGFDPDHFSKDAKSNRHPYAFMPFGHGPRNCIGMRFAVMEAKIALANLVRNFNLLPSEKTKEPLELDPSSAIAYAKGGLYINVEKRV